MARNEEKQVTRLNRLLLQQQREEEEKKNPPRPKLHTLHKAEEIKKWLPSIKRDIDFYLKQSKVLCYPERKIKEFEGEIDRLRKEYWAFVRRLRELEPSTGHVPWTDRPYQHKQRKLSGMCTGERNNVSANKEFNRLDLPILNSISEKQYSAERQPPLVLDINPNIDQDQPLQFKCLLDTQGDSILSSDGSTVPQDITCCQQSHEGHSEAKDMSSLSDTRKSLTFQPCQQQHNHKVKSQTFEEAGRDIIVSHQEIGKTLTNPLGIQYSSSDSDSGDA